MVPRLVQKEDHSIHIGAVTMANLAMKMCTTCGCLDQGNCVRTVALVYSNGIDVFMLTSEKDSFLMRCFNHIRDSMASTGFFINKLCKYIGETWVLDRHSVVSR